MDLWRAGLMADSGLQHELIRLMAQLPRLVPREGASLLDHVGVLCDLARVKPSAVAPIRNRILREALALCPPLEACGAGENPRESILGPDAPAREIVSAALLVLWMLSE